MKTTLLGALILLFAIFPAQAEENACPANHVCLDLSNLSVGLTVKGGTSNIALPEVNEKDESLKHLHFTLDKDISFLGIPALYITLTGEWIPSSKHRIWVFEGSYSSRNVSFWGWELGLMKYWPLGPFAVGTGIQGGAMTAYLTDETRYPDDALVSSPALGVTLVSNVSYPITPNWSVGLEGGWRLYTSSETWKFEKGSGDIPNTADFQPDGMVLNIFTRFAI